MRNQEADSHAALRRLYMIHGDAEGLDGLQEIEGNRMHQVGWLTIARVTTALVVVLGAACDLLLVRYSEVHGWTWHLSHYWDAPHHLLWVVASLSWVAAFVFARSATRGKATPQKSTV